ncbi:MAG: ABC transporter permease [Promethearchaeota archaeon]|nr:MAG: ABC transporter permease [Candidatus Lokiarchaeota archaeon]
MNDFFKYFIRKLGISIITIFGIIVITFFVTRALPGDPIWYRLPSKALMEDYLRERARLGLNKPIIYQFFIYMVNLLSGDWGLSMSVVEDSPVWVVISSYFTKSIDVMIFSMFSAIGLGILFGKISARKAHSFRDFFIRTISYLILSIPGFVLVVFFIQIILNTPFNILPLYGYKNSLYPNPPRVTNFVIIDSLISGQLYLIPDYLWHLIIPVAAMTIVQMVATIRHSRSSILEVFEMDFIRTAKAKGCSKRYIMKNHVMKNALPPIVTVSGMGFPLILGGMIAIEVAYNFVGLGYLFRKAVLLKDYPVFIGIIFIFSVLVIAINFITDLIIGYLDPRIRLK